MIFLGLELAAAFVLELYLAVSVNYDGSWLSVDVSLGALIITNASAYVAGYFAYYPNKKSVNEMSGGGFSASIGWGASLAPIPYYQTKFGYSWTVLKWNLSNIKNGTSITKSIFWTKVVKITKQSSYTDIYIFKMNKTIRVFTGTKKIKVF